MTTLYIDITNTGNTGGKTGIQRVVRELSGRLALTLTDIVFIRFHRPDRTYYRFGSPDDCLSRSFPPDNGGKLSLDFSQFQAGDIFFEMDAAWGDPLDRHSLLPELKRRGVIIVCMHYDAVPILFPDFSHPNTVFRYTGYIAAHLNYADYFICISDTVKKDLQRLSLDVTSRRTEAFTLPLGADFKKQGRADAATDPGVEKLLNRKFLLVVGTLEPRKNHAMVLDAFDRLDPALGLDLVLVGKQGWNIEALARQIKARKDFNTRVFWLETAGDQDLAILYQRAFACLNVAHYEGYGLPVIEAMNHDCVTICARGGALEEVARGCCLILEENTGRCLAREIKALVESPERYNEFKARAEGFACPTWDDACFRLVEVFEQIRAAENFNWEFVPGQAVYISVDPTRLALSVESVIRHMPFIREFVLLTAEAYTDDMARVLDRTQKPYTIVTDESVWEEAGVNPDDFEDHVRRNTFLRKAVYAHPAVDPNFISLDDDALVQKEISPDFFIKGSRHNAYFFMDRMDRWLGTPNRPTSYDSGIFSTERVLKACGYPQRIFSSHMPQIVNKKMASLVYSRMVTPDSPAMDEWSTYFNLLSHLFPDRCRLKTYQTLAWPCNATDWLPDVLPQTPVFENYYDINYQKDGLFYGKPPLGAFDEKIALWQKEFAGQYHQREMNKKQFGTDLPVVRLTDAGIETDLTDWGVTQNQLARIFLDNKTAALPRKIRLTARITRDGRTIRQYPVDPATSRWMPVHVNSGANGLDLVFQDLEKDEIIDQKQVTLFYPETTETRGPRPCLRDDGPGKEAGNMNRQRVMSRLMDIDDTERFVRETWDLILGRVPTPRECGFALAQLNAGVGRKVIITRVLLSPEAEIGRVRMSRIEKLRLKIGHKLHGLLFRVRGLERLSRIAFLNDHPLDQFTFDVQQRLEDQEHKICSIRDKMEDRLKDIESRVVYMQTQAARVQQHRLDQFIFDLRQELAATGDKAGGDVLELFADHALDDFYLSMEQACRGSQDQIKQRYLPCLDLVRPFFPGPEPVRAADLGCGRGEWLGILSGAFARVQGVDRRPAMVAFCREQGLDAECRDLLTWLEHQEGNSKDLITAFQVIEQFEFDDFSRMIREIFRVLSPGGVIMLETPNPENLSVASRLFYQCPGRKSPVPKELASHLLGFHGFAGIEVTPLHPFSDGMRIKEDSEVARRFNRLVYGPREYLVTARKPAEV